MSAATSRRPRLLLLVGAILACAAYVPSALASASPNGPPMGTNPFAYMGVDQSGNTSLCDPNYATDGYPENFTVPDSITGQPTGCQLEENTANLLAEAQALVRPIPDRPDGKALADLGYNLIQLDNGWQGPRVNGVLTPNPERYGTTQDFVNLIAQIKAMAGPVTGYHLQVGLYSDQGADIGCNSGGPYENGYGNGLANHEATDAQTFASWGVDYLKVDHICAGENTNEVQLIHDAFATYAPNMRLDIYWSGDTTGESAIWRLGSDECGCFSSHTDGWTSSILDHLQDAVADQAWNNVTYGNWDDMDNLLVHGVSGFGTAGGQANPYLTPIEQQTQFGLEALFSAPLLIGADVRTIVGVPGDPNYPGDPTAIGFLNNDDVIWVDQDDRNDFARDVTAADSGCTDGGCEVLSKLITNWGQTGTRAVGLLNESDSARNITFDMSTLRRDDGSLGAGLTNVTSVVDLWTGADASGNCTSDLTQCTFNVPAHGLALLEVVGTSQ